MDPEVLGWTAAIGGLVLGALLSVVPGVPGATVALLGVVAFAGATGFEVVGEQQLLLGALVALLAGISQALSPVLGSRALRGSASAATGAAVGAVIGSVLPLPGLAWLAAMVGAALLGIVGIRREPVAYGRGVAGTAGGCVVGAAVDLVGVLGEGALLAVSVFLARLP